MPKVYVYLITIGALKKQKGTFGLSHFNQAYSEG